MKKDTKVLALGNQKGGCAKTTDCLNIARSYSLKGKKVLLIDLDSQGSSGLNLGLPIADENLNTIDEILGAYVRREIDTILWDDLCNFIYSPTYLTRKRIANTTKWETVHEPFGFDIIPSSLPLSLVELQMSLASGQNNSGKIYSYYVYDLVDVIKQNADYDYIIIDTPPALGALSINAMTAATSGIIIPSNLDIMSFRGIQSFKESAEFVQQAAKERGIEHRGILGILLSLYSQFRVIDRALEEYVKEYYPTPTFSSTIRESSDAKRANAEGLLFTQINKKAQADFDKLTDEIDFAINNKDAWEKRNEEIWQNLKNQRQEEVE